MTIGVPSQFVPPLPRAGVTRRGLLKAGLGLTGVAGLVVPSTAAYAAVQAANDLIITDYRPVPPGWPDSHRLSITVVADLHAGGPQYGVSARASGGRCRQCARLRPDRDPRRLFRHPPLRHRAGAASGLGGRACPP